MDTDSRNFLGQRIFQEKKLMANLRFLLVKKKLGEEDTIPVTECYHNTITKQSIGWRFDRYKVVCAENLSQAPAHVGINLARESIEASQIARPGGRP